MRRAALLTVVLGATSSLVAQTITLKNHTVVDGKITRVSGGSVFTSVKIGGSEGVVGYPITAVEKIDFPKPPELQAAANLLHDGDALQALAKIDSVMTSQSPFRNVKGNWWLQAAALKLSALSALHRDEEAVPIITDVMAATSDPESVRTAKLYQAIGFARKGDFDEALAIVEPAINESRSPEFLAPAWLCAGDCRLGLKEYQSALLAYLHIPVFYPEEKAWMPGALLGSARAYEGIDDFEHAKTSLQTLQETYASSPEATSSKADLKRIEHKLKNPK